MLQIIWIIQRRNLQTKTKRIFMEEIKEIFEKEKTILVKAHEDIREKLQRIYKTLDQSYEEAYKLLTTAKFYVNQSFIRQTQGLVKQFEDIISMNSSQIQIRNTQSGQQKKLKHQNLEYQDSFKNIYLVDLSINGNSQSLLSTDKSIEKAQENQLQSIEPILITQFINKNRNNSQITLNKRTVQNNNCLKISIHCTQLNAIELRSHRYKQQFIFNNSDLQKISVFSNISSLNIMQSSVNDEGIEIVLKQFSKLKEINISGCCLLTDLTVRKLSGQRFVNLKMNNLNTISEQSILDLISQSYNLNYLEIKNNRQIDYQCLYRKITNIYDYNQSSFKWIEINTHISADLFVNKFAYMTNSTSIQSITDQEAKILLGKDKSLVSGLFFTNCQQLSEQTIILLVNTLKNLKRLKLSKFVNLNDSHIKNIASELIKIQDLDLSECYSLTNRSLVYMTDHLRNLRRLNLSYCRSITDEGIRTLCEKNRIIQSLNLSYCKNITDYGVQTICQNQQRLKSLNLQKCDQITDQSIEAISQTFTDLEQLVLNHCESLTDSSLSLIATRLRKLKVLEIQWCQVSQKCINYIALNLTKLHTLNLSYCPAVCDSDLLIIANKMVNLKTLKLESCDKISEQAFLGLSTSIHSIKHLDLKQCVGVTDAVIKGFCTSSQTHLKYLDVSWCTRLTDKSLFSISQYQHQLTHLNLSGCSELTDIGIQWLSSTLSYIQFLSLSLCQRLTDKSVSTLKKMKNLRRLYLCDLKKITDVSISSLSDISTLQELHISGCSQLTSSSLIALLHNLEKLSYLSINQCTNIHPNSLVNLFDRMKNLKKLQISSLDINDKFIQALGQNLPKLLYLNVSMCKHISEKVIEKMIQNMPNLIKIDLQNTSVPQRAKQKFSHTLNYRKMYNITLE